MNQENINIEEFTSDSISKFWNLLNNSNDIFKKQVANNFFSNLKEKCENYLELSIELFNKSNSIQDKLISSILIYQYIKEHYDKLIENKIIYNYTKDFLINKLISYINDTNIDIFTNSEESLIIERMCFSISLIIILGCFTFWTNAIDDILNFGKQTIKHTYLITIILGNCYEEIIDIFLTKSQENKIKEKFMKNKEELKNFINTIISSNNIDKKLYNKTIILSKNLIVFGINLLQMPKIIKIIFENSNRSNIDSLANLISKCIDYSKCKNLEDELCGLDLSEYDKKMNLDELSSINFIIEYIYIYINNIENNYDKDMIFGFGRILGDIINNYIYLMFKKDSISQKLLALFFYFISSKSRIISQLFFEPILIMKNFINACYKFNNYSDEEKVEFSNYLLKIFQNILINCTFKRIENQEILLHEENFVINHNKNENQLNINNDLNEKELSSKIEELNEIEINEYRANAEDAFFNIFLIFAINFLSEGINYFFETITNPIIPLLSKNITEVSLPQILSIESIIYSIKSIVNSFESLISDKEPIIQFISILIKSDIINHDFIFSNFLLLLEESSTFFDYNNNIYSDIINFLLVNINTRINKNNQEIIVQLCTAVFLNICESCENVYNKEIVEKIYFIYKNYYNKLNEISLYNITETICSCIIPDDTNNEININEILNYFERIIEIPLNNIKNISDNNNNNNLIEKEIKKNFNVLERIFKQSSFVKDKSIINSIFNALYLSSFSNISKIIHQYIPNSDMIKPFLKMLTKISLHLSSEIINNIFNNLNQFLIEIFMKNSENYQTIYVLKNLYITKLKDMSDKTFMNKEYIAILDNFVGINRHICSLIIQKNYPQNILLDLIQSLLLFFNQIFPLISNLRKDDYIIICDTITTFIEVIKSICENNIIKNVLISFTCFINSKFDELINMKFNDIIKGCFYSLENYNISVINYFINFCFDCLKYNKKNFLINLNEILFSEEFKFLNEKYKKIVFDYFDIYSNDLNKLKNIIIDFVAVYRKINVPEILEEYKNDLLNCNKDSTTTIINLN